MRAKKFMASSYLHEDVEINVINQSYPVHARRRDLLEEDDRINSKGNGQERGWTSGAIILQYIGPPSTVAREFQHNNGKSSIPACW